MTPSPGRPVRRTLALLSPLLGAFASAAGAGEPGALLEYASRQHFAAMPYEERYQERLGAVQHELRVAPPPASGCAHSLGAQRFAAMFADLGETQSGLGRSEEALEAYDKALACGPRNPDLHASRASQLYHLGRYEEVRAALKHGLRIDPDHSALHAMLAQLDFVTGRWREASERFARLARGTRDADQAPYWVILAWLAQRRAGIAEPRPVMQLVGTDWPRPIMQALRGEIAERELLVTIEQEENEVRRRELLVEALFYVGEESLAAGERTRARRYLAAAVNLKVLHFIEHHLARAELARMRGEEEEEEEGE